MTIDTLQRELPTHYPPPSSLPARGFYEFSARSNSASLIETPDNYLRFPTPSGCNVEIRPIQPDCFNTQSLLPNLFLVAQGLDDRAADVFDISTCSNLASFPEQGDGAYTRDSHAHTPPVPFASLSSQIASSSLTGEYVMSLVVSRSCDGYCQR